MADKAQADIAYGFNTVVASDPAYYALSVMNNILGQYALGGRLGDNIRERQGMAYYVFSAFEPNLGEGPLVIRAGVNPANVDRTIAAIDEEVRRMAADGVTAEELAASKKYLVGSMPRMLETNAGDRDVPAVVRAVRPRDGPRREAARPAERGDARRGQRAARGGSSRPSARPSRSPGPVA